LRVFLFRFFLLVRLFQQLDRAASVFGGDLRFSDLAPATAQLVDQHARTDQQLINWLTLKNEPLPFARVEATIKTKSAFLATERTFFPIPFPEAAPLMIPGKSMTCIFAPLYSIIPGIAVSVVN